MTCKHAPPISMSQKRRFGVQCITCSLEQAAERVIEHRCSCGHIRGGVDDEGKFIGHQIRHLGYDMWDLSCRECDCMGYVKLLSD